MKTLTNVLIVDDDATIRSIMASMIRHLPITIQEAHDGYSALECIKLGHIDVVISDLVMPKMSGLMLLHSMIELGIQIPFILTTGFGDKDSAIQALRLGVFDYLEKPIHEADLRSVVEEAIRVSLDQKVVMNPPGDGTQSAVQRIDPRARSLILKLKAFHATKKEDLPSGAEVMEQEQHWNNILDIFVKETVVLADAALEKIEKNEGQLRLTLGYCLRIAQSIRFAARALAIRPVAELAWHCEFTAASLKLASEHHAKEAIPILKDGFRELKRQIEELTNPQLQKVLGNLQKLQVRLKKSA